LESVHPETFFFKGIHTIDFKISSTLAQIHLEKYGFKTFLFCEAFQDEILSVLETVKSFVGGMGLHKGFVYKIYLLSLNTWKRLT